MPITQPARPLFLIRRLLDWMGEAIAPERFRPTSSSLNELVKTSEVVEEWWASLESLVLALNLAGYECPEVIVTKQTEPARYLRMPCWQGLTTETASPFCFEVQAAPQSLTGVDPSAMPSFGQSFLRVEVRRTVDTPVRVSATPRQPPRFPPVALDGIVPTYLRHPTSGDIFADAADGWISFTHLAPDLSNPLKVAERLRPDADAFAAAVVDALVDAWVASVATAGPQGVPADVGLLRALDPTGWESALDRAAWVYPFDALCAEIWTAMAAGGWQTLRARLKDPLGDAGSAFQTLAAGRGVAVDEAVGALQDRRNQMMVTDENLDSLLAALTSPPSTAPNAPRARHWVLTLMALHEFGLLRIVPFALAAEPEIPFVDLTGWYETTYRESGRSVNAALQLNQAGDRIVGWLLDGQLVRWDLTGQFLNPAPTSPLMYALELDHDGDKRDGTLDLIPRDDGDEMSIRLTFPSASYVLTRRHRHALLPPTTVRDTLGDLAPEGIEDQVTPLHSNVVATFDRVAALLEAALLDMAPTGPDAANADLRLTTLESDLRHLLEDEGLVSFDEEQIDVDGDGDEEPVVVAQLSPMLQRLRREVTQRLGRMAITTGADGDGVSQLRRVVAEVKAESNPLPSAVQIERMLGDMRVHQYSFTLVELGVVPGFGAVLGGEAGAVLLPCQMIHDDACGEPPGPPHGWTEYYLGAAFQAGVSLATEADVEYTFFTVSTDNDMSAPEEWDVDDFVPSVFVIGETSLFGSFQVGASFAKAGPVISAGPEYEEYAIYGRKGWMTGSGDGIFLSVGAGFAVSPIAPFGFGWNILGLKGGVFFARAGLVDPTPDAPPPSPPRSLSQQIVIEKTSTFAFDESELTLPAKDELALIVARHRQILESPHSRVTIEGDASPPGEGDYNDRLSWDRALAVYRHIRALLGVPPGSAWVPGDLSGPAYAPGNAFAVRDSRVDLFGFGETRVEYGADLSTFSNDDWQRCKVILNGQIAVIV